MISLEVISYKKSKNFISTNHFKGAGVAIAKKLACINNKKRSFYNIYLRCLSYGTVMELHS